MRILSMSMLAATLAGDFLVVNQVLRSYLVIIIEYDTWADLIFLDIVAFDAILSID